MSDKNFSRRRRGGMRFRPSGGMNQPKSDRGAQEARAEVIGEKPPLESIYDKSRVQHEIERAENVAAGLPPEGAPKPEVTETKADQKGEFRQPNMETPEVVEEQTYKPVEIK